MVAALHRGMFFDSEEEDDDEAAPPPGAAALRDEAARRGAEELARFLTAHDLGRLVEPLQTAQLTLDLAAALGAASRVELLKRLQSCGVSSLADRQAVANALARGMRSGELRQLTTAQLLEALAERAAADEGGEGEEERVRVPYDVPSQSASDAPQLIPRVIYQTNRSRVVGAAAWRNVVRVFEKNPDYSYAFYDDERCARLIADAFPREVSVAFASLRAGAAKADLWRYCCL